MTVYRAHRLMTGHALYLWPGMLYTYDRACSILMTGHARWVAGMVCIVLC